jgi:non-ribosomal peptide synthetase component F
MNLTCQFSLVAFLRSAYFGNVFYGWSRVLWMMCASVIFDAHCIAVWAPVSCVSVGRCFGDNVVEIVIVQNEKKYLKGTARASFIS